MDVDPFNHLLFLATRGRVAFVPPPQNRRSPSTFMITPRALLAGLVRQKAGEEPQKQTVGTGLGKTIQGTSDKRPETELVEAKHTLCSSLHEVTHLPKVIYKHPVAVDSGNHPDRTCHSVPPVSGQHIRTFPYYFGETSYVIIWGLGVSGETNTEVREELQLSTVTMSYSTLKVNSDQIPWSDACFLASKGVQGVHRHFYVWRPVDGMLVGSDGTVC
ncbi:hypothetical protein PM082_017216 [Marasmius tenuissimus]|nr:hypothetical protein PM082_017216 [Marasmius tenuissimus]